MRPIKLKIKGLNSFIEEQVIDFEKLTDRGLFGIFGPTGSGKSTILDGITLALYGELARKSSNYVNTNCSEASVSFEFQISGVDTKRYIVDRQFKRDTKSGNPRTSGARIIDISKDQDVISNGVNQVTKTCKDIIGLSLDDFTRTVVLPQGKFSDFLKLEGKQRRDMLERLFNLQNYGDNLSSKLSKEISQEKSDYQFLMGQLELYDDVSKELLDEKKTEFEKFSEDLKNKEVEFKQISSEFEDCNNIWNLQLEILDYEKEKTNLDNKKDEINDKIDKVKLAERAHKVMPYINQYLNTLKDIDKSKEKLSIVTIALESVKIEKDKINDIFNIIFLKKNNELLDLIKYQEKIETSLSEKSELDSINIEIKELKEQVFTTESRVKKGELYLSDREITLKNNTDSLKKLQEKYESLKIDDLVRSKVNEGIIITEKLEDKLIQLTKDNHKLNNFEMQNDELLTNKNKTQKLLNKNIKILMDSRNRYEELIKNCPGSQDDLLNLQSKLVVDKEKWDNFKYLSNEIEKSEKIIKELKSNLSKDYADIEKLRKELNLMIKNQDKLKMEVIAQELRKNLSEGEHCPVCGSVSHKLDEFGLINIDNDNISKEINSKELDLKSKEQSIIRDETIIKNQENSKVINMSKIESLGNEFKNIPIEVLEENFISLKSNLEKYIKEKDILEIKIKDLNEETITLDNSIKNIDNLLNINNIYILDIKKEIEKRNRSLEELSTLINSLKAETNVDDFINKNKDFVNMENERNSIEVSIKEYRSSIENATIEKDKALDLLHGLKSKLIKESTTLNEKVSIQRKLENSIVEKIGKVEDLSNELNKVRDDINKINSEYERISKEKEEIESKDKDIRNQYISIDSKYNDLKRRERIDEESLAKLLNEERFHDIDDVKNNLLSGDEITVINKEVEEYKEDIAKTMGAVESLLKKKGNRKVSEIKWKEIKDAKTTKEEEIKYLNKEKVTLENELDIFKKKLKEQEGFIEKKKNLDKKLDVLYDLEKLFKGKKFVEFVATNQLKYISVEASKRLKDITNGEYGIEVNEDSRFIIRDYKNGGATRDASTLSGGEVFLTSLALALSLSSQIQLKGSSPLELFFLDEGFGTLDDNMLEVVMDSLERIHHERLKVGIISHVESIKTRAPVKLLISPAKSGLGGSKVKIERT